jgi:glycosyltransferase involved in cell wall biosynthesis
MFTRLFQLLIIAPKSDVVIFQKSVIPYIPINCIRYLKKRKVKVIFDVDDAIFVTKRDYSDDICKLSDITVVGNNYLMKHYSSYSNDIIKIPTVDYTPEYVQYRIDSYSKKCIGWIGGAAQIYNLDAIVPAINEVIKRHENVKFKFICDSPHGYDEKIINAEFCKWNIETYKMDMADFTVGIMPLENTEYNKGKCGFKLIQYLNLEKPVIASPVGVNADIVGNCGIIANDIQEWVDAFEKCLFDESMYKEYLKAIQTEFQEKYSYNVVLDKWRYLLNTI